MDWKPANRSKADELAEPTAAPVGHSLKIAPGSGLVAYAVPVPLPSAPDAADESVAVSSVAVGGGNDDMSEMGMSVGSPPAAAAAAGDSSVVSCNSDKKSEYDDIPVPQVVQPEEDIYIPPAPGATGIDSKPPANDDSDDLQARFNNLKK